MTMYNIIFRSGATLSNVGEKAAFQAPSVPEVRYIQNAETGELVWGMDYDTNGNPVFEDDNKPEKAEKVGGITRANTPEDEPVPYGFDVQDGEATDPESLKKHGLCYPFYIQLRIKNGDSFKTEIYQSESSEEYNNGICDIATQKLHSDNKWEDGIICWAAFYRKNTRTGRYEMENRINF